MFKGLLFFVRFGWNHRKRYIIYLLLDQFISSLIPLAAIVVPKFIIEELMGQKRIEHIVFWVAILLVYVLLASMASNFLRWKSFGYRAEVAAKFDVFIHSKTMMVDYADLETSEYIDMKERAKKFLFGNMHGFSYVLDRAVSIIGKIITLAGVIVIVAKLNPILVLVFILIVAVNAFIESRIRRKQIELSLELTQIERRWMYLNSIMEDFSYGKEIRINDLSEWLIGKVKLHAENSRKLYTKSNDYGIKGGSFSALASFLQQGIAYAYLISEVLKSNVSIGEFTMYIGGVTAFSGALREVMSTIIEVGQFRQYYDALETYLNVEPKMRENEKLPVDKIKHTIEFKNVWFKYTKSENYALKNINIKITQGEKISIIGENGSGKTTFVKLLCRIYDPSGGEIFLDGVNIKQIDYDEYMRLFSTVFQDYKLFSFSLLENVALGKGETGNNISVQSALSQAGFGERLNTLCDGVNTFVYKNFSGEGFEPSGGEGQKIALARAIYKDAPFVILDEPTSALDPKAEYEMYMNFNKIVSEDKLAVYISHRLASTKFCDRILVFHEGCIIEKGTHKDLLRARGKYHSLYKMQRDMYY